MDPINTIVNFKHAIGDYDIRGCIGDDFGPDQAYLIGLSFGSIIQCQGLKTVAVGYDRRSSSVEFHEKYIEGLLESGVDVVSLGRVSTAYTALSYKFLEIDASTMITASHNPIKYNGFKFYIKGRNFYGQDLIGLYDRIKNNTFSKGKGKRSYQNFMTEYSHYIFQNMDIENTNVIWDAGHGVAGDMLNHLRKYLPSSHILFRTEENAQVKDFDNTKIDFLNHTCKALRNKENYIAFAFDGDADRMVVVDENQKIWSGDELLSLFSIIARITQNREITTVWDSKSSKALMSWAEKFGINTVLSKTGHCYVINAIRKNNAELGGEISGHYMFRDSFFCADDGIYSALRLLQIMKCIPYRLCDIRNIIPKIWTSKPLRINCGDLNKYDVMEFIKESLSRSNIVTEKVHDSILINHHNGWWLVRASQTENVISARCEGWNEESYEEVKNFMEVTLSACGLSL
ncbi:phosphohexomutase domain-containing protein [Candidatus Cytomitobacter primus]|uniref:Phosphomannomutase/phosphoglucomutase n=1 Tax=Candidatus Cytomitobacter primus TaxID=2066024 RepID=A0A5C0UFH3_9PROT|nr:hypothetical protein [Candidatus Cytomitobacter primus]QEK38393.1 hypothetical protein FZC34_00460 [Candidatus Cytomitobacter primus]